MGEGLQRPSSSRGYWDGGGLYGLVPSMRELRKDTSRPYLLHLALGSGKQPFSSFLISPCAIHLLFHSTSVSLSPRAVITSHSQGCRPIDKSYNWPCKLWVTHWSEIYKYMCICVWKFIFLKITHKLIRSYHTFNYQVMELAWWNQMFPSVQCNRDSSPVWIKVLLTALSVPVRSS